MHSTKAGTIVSVDKSPHSKCNRCHKALPVLFNTDTVNFGKVELCWRCLHAIRATYISQAEYEKAMDSAGLGEKYWDKSDLTLSHDCEKLCDTQAYKHFWKLQ